MKFTTILVAAALTVFGAVAGEAATYTFQHVTVIDGRGHAPQRDMSVVVEDGRFVSILPSRIAGPPHGHVIDGRGKYLIPGLMDIHAHIAGWSRGPQGEIVVDRRAGEAALAAYLYCGVTTILDVGNQPQNILPLREDERAGRIRAPHIFATGNAVTYPGGHGADVSVPVRSWPEAEAQLQAQIASQRPDVQKIMYDEEGWGARAQISILPLDLLRHIIEFYNDHGIRTTIHVSSETRAREAIFAGSDSLAHTPLQGPVSERFVKLMAAKQIPAASTIAVGDNYGRLHVDPGFLDQPLYTATMPPEQRARLKEIVAQGGETALPGSSPLYRRTWRLWMQTQVPVLQDSLRRIVAAGGVIAAGTDTSSAASTQRELELLSQAGIPNLEVIRIATYNGARLLGKQGEMGSIEEGKIADAVLLNADPLANINNTQNIALVMKAGDVIDESKLPLSGGRQTRRYDGG